MRIRRAHNMQLMQGDLVQLRARFTGQCSCAPVQGVQSCASSAASRPRPDPPKQMVLLTAARQHTCKWSFGVPRNFVPSVYLLSLPKNSGTHVPISL